MPERPEKQHKSTAITTLHLTMDTRFSFLTFPKKQYHFTNNLYAMEAAFRFNPEHTTSLLHEKHGDGYKTDRSDVHGAEKK